PRHGQAVSALRVPANLAARRSLTADAKLYASACRSCEEELEVLSGSISARVRGMLTRAGREWPSLTAVATELAMSRSTLIRRLAEEGQTYQGLVDEVRRELA